MESTQEKMFRGGELPDVNTCPSCNQEVAPGSFYCSHCGSKIINLAPNQIGEAAVLGKILSDWEAPLDKSQQGISYLQSYIDNVLNNIKVYGNLLLGIQEHQGKVRQNPRLPKNKDWQMTAKTLMMGLATVSICIPSKEAGNPKLMIKTPPGCFGIYFELYKLQQLTTNFVNDYDNFVSKGDRNSLDKAGKIQVEIADRLNRVTDEIDKVVKMINR